MKIILVAKAMIIDAAGDLLVVRRSGTHPKLAGKADLPGGQFEPGEEPGAAVLREISEEVGLNLHHEDLRLVYAGTEAHEDESRVRMLYVIKLDVTKPEITLSWEHDKLDWRPVADLAQIETEFHSFYHDAMGYVREHGLLES